VALRVPRVARRTTDRAATVTTRAAVEISVAYAVAQQDLFFAATVGLGSPRMGCQDWVTWHAWPIPSLVFFTMRPTRAVTPLSGGVRLVTWTPYRLSSIRLVINWCFDCKITGVKSANPSSTLLSGGRRMPVPADQPPERLQGPP
jgi:hypothetical protein